MNRISIIAVVLVALARPAMSLLAQTPQPEWDRLAFLIGEWEGAGDPAGATGGFAFARGAQDHVVVRTNYSNTPAKGDLAASRHDDLMIIYAEGGALKADYFDSEGHVIRYILQPPSRADEVVFVSEIKGTEPRYRLTYARQSAAALAGRFDVAPPGRPDAFAPYLTWSARRRH